MAKNDLNVTVTVALRVLDEYDILAGLKNVKGPDGSGNYLACCPAHDDKKQSLSVKQGDKGVVMKCYAGCGVREIYERLSIPWVSIFEEGPETEVRDGQE